jgi:hypothetical protein
VVTFTPPVVLPSPTTSHTWNFTVASGGSPCLSYKEDANKTITMTVMGQTVTETGAGSSLTVKCPDGKSYSNPNALNLLSCPNFFAGIPGILSSDSSTSLSVGLLGTGSDADGGDQSFPVFDCRVP